MSVKKQRSSQTGANVKTSARLAPLSYVFGVVILTLGIAWLISLMTNVGSVVMGMLKNVLIGLSGRLYFALPLLFIWLGTALFLHAYHRVSARNILLAFCLYLAASAMITMVTFVTGKGNLMEYAYTYNQQRLVASPGSIAAYMQRLFTWGSDGAMQLCGGGALSILFAYPAFKLFGVIGGIIFLGVLLIVLFLALTRINVIDSIRTLSDRMEKRRIRRAQKQTGGEQKKKEQNQERQQTLPYEELRRGQQVQIETTYEQTPAASDYDRGLNTADTANGYAQTGVMQEADPYSQPDAFSQQSAYAQEAPAPYEGYVEAPQQPYPAQPTYYQPPEATFHQQMQDGFYPVNNGDALYDERFVLHPERSPGNASNAPEVYEQQPHASTVQSNVNKRETATPPPAAERPAAANRTPQTQKAAVPVHQAPEKAVPFTEAVQPKDDADIPPWEDEPPKHKNETISQGTKPEQTASDWKAQLQKKKEELDRQARTEDAPAKLPQSAKPLTDRAPKQVFTDPAVELTGERVPISPGADGADKRDARMDGTPRPPTIRQMEMPMLVAYTPPSINLLGQGKAWSDRPDTTQEDQQRAQQIERTLATFNITSQVREITHGPAITRFALKLAEGVKVKQVISVLDNIALDMASDRVRVEAPIPGTTFIGIEVPNSKVSSVMLREVLDSEEMRKNTSPLVVALGKDIAGKPILCDLSKMPHLLIAGATGSGKSVCINSIVCSLLYRASPTQVRLIMVDPKQVELQVYNGIPHLLVPVVSDPKKASSALNWVVQEMFERYGKFSAKNVRNLEGYNRKMAGTDEELPNIVVIIDEMADLMDACRKDVEESVRRLAALARAAGIYMVLATQRPSVDVITGVIKNNIPSRIAFTVSSGVDSRTIIDINGAEKLMGKGDMLYQPTGAAKPTRVQGCYVSDEEVMSITDYIRQRYQADYNPNIQEHMEQQQEAAEDPMDDDGGVEPTDTQFDDLLKEAIRMAVEDGQSSISMLQRRLRVGYARAGRLIDEMTKRGIITESEGSKPRKTKITHEQYMEMMRDD